MKKVFLVFVLSLVMAGSAFALGDNTNKQDQNQGQAQGQMQGQAQGQAQGQIGINQSRNTNSNRNTVVGINDNTNCNTNRNSNKNDNRSSAYSSANAVAVQGQSSSQANGQTMTNNVEEKHKRFESVGVSYPTTDGDEGTNNFNGYSIFGGVGISQTAEYKIAITKLQTIKVMENDGYLNSEEAKAEAKEAFNQLKYSTKDKRFLGVLWKTTGRNLLNGFGLLAWDSFWS